MSNQEPKFGTLADWYAISGMKRTSTYYAMVRGDLKAVRLGSRTMVDIEAGLAWLRSLPAATAAPIKVCSARQHSEVEQAA